MNIRSIILSAVLLAAFPRDSLPQKTNNNTASGDGPIQIKNVEALKLKHTSFTFVRIMYSSRAAIWSNDYPEADINFSARFQQVTRLKADAKGRALKLTDPNLHQYPFVYIVEGAQMELTAEEVESLRHYLLGGGFLMVDDFWGEREWEMVRATMKRVFPEREPVDLPLEHPIFHCFYDIREKPQVPNVFLGTQSQQTGITWERLDGKESHYRGLFDDNGRLMAIFCHNTDLGDGWESAKTNEYYYREFSLKKAYPMGINIVVYALAH